MAKKLEKFVLEERLQVSFHSNEKSRRAIAPLLFLLHHLIDEGLLPLRKLATF
jgi:hypothetical protein